MKFFIVFVALFAVALADVQILRLESEVGPESYNNGYELDNGQKADEKGELENIGTEYEAISVKGSYTWVDPDGKSHTISYIADKNGYQPQGEDLPQL